MNNVKLARKLLRLAKQVLSYLKLEKNSIIDPKRLLQKANRILKGKLKVNRLPPNWGFSTQDFERPSSVYTTADENGKFDSTWLATTIFAHRIDEPAPSGQGNMFEIDQIIISDRKMEDLTGKRKKVVLK